MLQVSMHSNVIDHLGVLVLLFDLLLLFFLPFEGIHVGLVDSTFIWPFPQYYLRLSGVYLEIHLFKFIPVVDEIRVDGFPLQTTVEQLPEEVVVWPFIKLDGADIIHKIDDF